MDQTDQITGFLAAVDELRGEDATVRTTAHTSRVSAEGWPAVADAPVTAEDGEGTTEEIHTA
ncbi:hypothetical protein ABTY61_06890 [Kitasatospora sp. NPDC096128]|uniref:hypothetical protein n=1 Tax=Kitasatospora sp. NPDC096128 TaxID=3155547 RepID=UPI00331FA899